MKTARMTYDDFRKEASTLSAVQVTYPNGTVQIEKYTFYPKGSPAGISPVTGKVGHYMEDAYDRLCLRKTDSFVAAYVCNSDGTFTRK